jgi:hypothetical protein
LEEFAYDRGAELIVIGALDELDAARALDPLAEMADKTNRAVIMVLRSNKNERRSSAIERLAGTGALADAASSILAVIEDHYSTDQRDRVLFVAKSRHAPVDAPGLCFRVTGEPAASPPCRSSPYPQRPDVDTSVPGVIKYDAHNVG